MMTMPVSHYTYFFYTIFDLGYVMAERVTTFRVSMIMSGNRISTWLRTEME